MLRKRGYALKGPRLIYRGEFTRTPIISCLSFIGENGLVDYFEVSGTFNRAAFVVCLTYMAKENTQVRKYPGKNSVWIIDGARIHIEPNIVHMCVPME